jgi:very-short-patch-repair endonuclease
VRYLYNHPILKPRRKKLRNESTEAEWALWQELKGSRFQELKFVRQYSVGPYILDFYCPEVRLAIELDGQQHAEDQIQVHDEERTQFLMDKNIVVIRFWNNQIFNNLGHVLKEIEKAVTPLLR